MYGPFVVGLAVPEGPPLGSALVDKLDAFSSGVLLPTFITLVTLRTSLSDLVNMPSKNIFASAILIAVPFISKIVSSSLVALYCKMPLNDAIALGLIMSAKGVVDLATYSILKDLGEYFVAVIFVGGNDDQEALTLARRMTRNNNINLSIIRYLSKGREGSDMDDDVLDMKVLFDFKQKKIGQGNVTYIEKIVDDCSEMVWLLRSIANEYDLIIVGRRYKVKSSLISGLEEWSDVPELGIVLIFMLTHFFHFPLKRLGIPKLVSEIGVGLILGSSGLGGKYELFQKFLFPAASQGILGAFTTFGFMLFIFLNGVKMDPSMIRKTGMKAIAIGIVNLVAPVVVGGISMIGYSKYDPTGSGIDVAKKQRNHFGILLSHSISAFPVIAQLLKDLKILNSELGRLALSSAMIHQILVTSTTSLITLWFLTITFDYVLILYDLICIIVFVVLATFVIRPALKWVVQETPEGRPVKDLYVYVVILLFLASAVVAHIINLGVLIGPFIVGLAIPEGPPLGSAVVDKLEAFSSGLLLPTFMSIITLRASLSTLVNMPTNTIIFSTIPIVVTSVSKIVACALVALYFKMPLNDAIALGLIMSTKGEDLAVYSFAKDQGMMDQLNFTLSILATAVIATFVPFMVRLLYDPSRKYANYQKRNIMHSRLGGKLPILTCIHSSDNIVASVNLLDAFTPTTEYPIIVHALHLIELRGRASPIFISHQAQRRIISNISYSENVILAFKQFERNNWGAVSFQAFTAISPRKLMHEDICTLSLNVLASIIILPFHRKWGIDGSIEYEDHSLRTLNRSILERSPCSVGILIDSGHLGRSSSMASLVKTYSIVVIFLGGNDDQEALTLARRMTRNDNINLTIIRYLSKGRDNQGCSDMDDDVLDIKVLYDFKQNRIGRGKVTYIEKIVDDCSEMVWLLRSIANEYDLIIVGRRYKVESSLTSGLEEWSDVPELGVIGDLLASGDLRRRASVLVVQQQKTRRDNQRGNKLQIVLIFMLTHLFHFPLKRLGIPKLVSEIGAGLILGSSGLGGKYEMFQKFLFPAASQGILGAFAAFGYIIFMFLSGVKMDTGMIRKTGPKAIAIGVVNLVAPIVVGGVALSYSNYDPAGGTNVAKKQRNRFSILISHSGIQFPVIALLLKDLKILNSELGRLALSSSLINYILEIIMTSFVTLWFQTILVDYVLVLYNLLCWIVFVVLVIFVIRPSLRWVIRQTPEGRPVKDLYIYLVILLCLASAIFTHIINLGMLFGPFIVGLAVPEGPPLGSAVVDKLEAFSSGVLLPTFISIVTLKASLSTLINTSTMTIFVSVIPIVVTFVSKITACSLVALYCKMPLNDAIALGLIMSAKGVDLAYYGIAKDLGVIDQPNFALSVLATAVIAMFVPFTVRLLYDPNRKYASYQKRNIMHSRLGRKLPILTCIHSSDNIMATIKLLDVSTPTTENPIIVHALHLIELRGQASPIFISHQVQRRIASNISYSENVIHAFKKFERNNWGAVSAEAFTAISPRKLMHEDICTLALNVLASIIILPFHQKWGIDGSIEYEDQSLRTLNQSVLERSPCSVGILINRGHLERSNSMTSTVKAYFVAVIFLGGNDDQEALTLARRMTRNDNINLTVIRYLSKDHQGSVIDDDMFDIEVLCDFKQNRIGQGNVTYIEKVVNDCTEMVWLVKSIADEYDLILVGRRYKVESPLTSGLEEWSDVPELGAIGDLLVSSDLRRRASVLVVQQQKTMY
ncbi:hypothetical protein ACH5RR_007766 [Cinchona calisaya]|uniref:Cation/H+ exchanger domain-containing protein n=1 Tax=Cinchona calisaya TaxID=153742 RepID=A0ABD3A9S7_9GENT